MPRESIVADLNIDGLSMWPFEALVARGALRSTISKSIEIAAAEANIKLVPDPFRQPIETSDQYSFLERGIPAVIFGATRTPEGRAMALEWLHTRYHEPSDDMNQPMDFDAAARFTHIMVLVARAIANADERPHMK